MMGLILIPRSSYARFVSNQLISTFFQDVARFTASKRLQFPRGLADNAKTNACALHNSRKAATNRKSTKDRPKDLLARDRIFLVPRDEVHEMHLGLRCTSCEEVLKRGVDSL